MTFSLLLLLVAAAPDDPFRSAATQEIRELIHGELWEHYDVTSVSVIDVVDHTGEWGGYHHGYGIRTVATGFVAVRNASWNEGLNRQIPQHLCDGEAELYLLCRPLGHEFSGIVEVDLAFTVDGWKVLSRNHRNRRRFPLANYLRCDIEPLDDDAVLIRRCFGASPEPLPAPGERDP